MQSYDDYWAKLKHRELVAMIAFIGILPIALIAGYIFTSGAAYFITFLLAGLAYVILRLRAMWTPCPRCNRPFGSSRRLVYSPKCCVHCGLVRGTSNV